MILDDDRKKRFQTPNGLKVLLAAFAIRLAYCFILAPRSLCGLHDKDNIVLGNALYAALISPQPLQQLTYPIGSAFDHFGTLLSALIRMGPLHAAYLAEIQFIARTSAATAPEAAYKAFIIGNCLIDAISCVAIYYAARFAFNRRIAVVAAVLAVLYPPSIVNTLQCFPESVAFCIISSSLMLLFWALLRGKSKRARLAVCLLLGAACGKLMLCIPMLILLPIFVGLLVFVYKVGASKAVAYRYELQPGPLDIDDDEPIEDPVVVTQISTLLAKLHNVAETVESGTAAKPESAHSFEPEEKDVRNLKVDDTEFDASPIADRSAPSTVPNVDKLKQQTNPEANEGTNQEVVPHSGAEITQAGSGEPAIEASNTETEQPISGTALNTEPDQVSGIALNTETGQVSGTALNTETGQVSGIAQNTETEQSRNRALRYTPSIIAVSIGVMLLVLPWLYLQQLAVGKIELFSVPFIASKLWTGNLLPSDGWTTLPTFDILVSDLPLIFKNLLRSLATVPVPYTLLAAQKVPRLWAGSWNDFQSTVFGIGPDWMDAIHCLLLFFAFFGVAIGATTYKSWKYSRMLPCVVALVAVVMYHFVYCLLTPVSRNAFTAMPAVLLLSAFGLERLFSAQNARLKTIGLVFVSLVVFSWMASAGTTVPFFMELTQSLPLSRGLDVILLLGAILGLFLLALRCVPAVVSAGAASSAASDVLKSGAFCMLVLTLACSFSDLRWKEWVAELKSNHGTAVQTIVLPTLANVPQLERRAKSTELAFVLVDAGSGDLAPPLTVSINDKVFETLVLPWLALKPMDSEAVSEIMTQAKAEGADWRTFRQWWAIPIPFSELKFGKANEIILQNRFNERPFATKVYGQYGEPALHQNGSASVAIMPSPYNISWDKGFATYERGDMRLYESMIMQGIAKEPGIKIESIVRKGDLSFDRGYQTGLFRMRLAVPYRMNIAEERNRIPAINESAVYEIWSKDEPVVYSSKQGPAQIITGQPLTLPPGLDIGSQLYFKTSISSSRPGVAALNLEFSGLDEFGHRITWISPWQPEQISVEPTPRTYVFSDSLPEKIIELHDLRATITLSPKQGTEAVTGLLSRNAETDVTLSETQFKILPSMRLPEEREREWIIF